jgi:hypothetical protein
MPPCRPIPLYRQFPRVENPRAAPFSFKKAIHSRVFTLTPLLPGKARKHHCEILDQARQLVESGQLVPVLDERCSTLNYLADTYCIIRAGAARGKLVFETASNSQLGNGHRHWLPSD